MTSNIKQSENNRGFSLMELIIVVAIIGLLGISANFLYSPANSRLKQAARDLYSNMQSARLEAIKRNTDWGIVFNNVQNSYAICAPTSCVGDNTTISLSDYGSEIQFGFGDANASITGASTPFDVISYTADSHYFNSKGLSPKLGYVYLENNQGTTFAVGTSSLAGVVKINKWSEGTNSWE